MDDYEARIRSMEELLFELAVQLRRVPLAADTTKLHVRALDLKRSLNEWRAAPPDDAQWETLGAELESLAAEVRRNSRPPDTERRPKRV